MVTAIILVNVERSKINEVAEELATIRGISEVYSVSGRYDLVAIARVQSNEELAELVTRQLLKIEFIVKTESLLAFRAVSRHDLDAIFSLGFTED
jgi:DNA-binding Lrp family transcriptional regulator